jgi:gamma-glutamyltranspeptidase/glutathione hydrolase
MLLSTSSKSKLYFILFICLAFNFVFARNPIRAKNGMVVSAEKYATEIGVSILQKGGNAVDAAVAVGFALAVTYPSAGNIGGGGFLVLYDKNNNAATLDFREKAPLKAHSKMFLDSLGSFVPELSQNGWKSAGIPGTVAGLCYALKKYGSMSLAEVIQPAIDLAENGFELDYHAAKSINSSNKDFNKYEASRKIFTIDGSELTEGQLFIQTDLANALKLIRDKGADEFYSGSIASRIVEESDKNGGIFSLEDFNTYKVIERKPIVGSYRDYKIISMGPPSSGGICLIQSLNVLENYTFDKKDWNSSGYLHKIIETCKYVYANRAEHIGDSDFISVPVNFLTSKDYAHNIYESITDSSVASLNISAGMPAKKESEETTHYSIADKFGNAVSVTYTLNSSYGNKIVVDGLGFLLNNEMDDFSAKPGEPNQYGLLGSYANSIQPAKRMLSSMTPTIILKYDKPIMIIGTPGGATIITQVLQSILNVIDFGMNIEDAISVPRIHHQWLPDEVFYEPFGLSDDVIQNLKKKGHKFGKPRRLGLMEGIFIDYNENVFYGSSDPRGTGKAMGF